MKNRNRNVAAALVMLTVAGGGAAYAALGPYAFRAVTRNADNDGDITTFISPTDGSVGLVGVKGTPNVPRFFSLGSGLSESGDVISVGPISLSSGVTGTLPVANGGTGATSLASAQAALLPSQSGQSGKFLRTDGTVVSWASGSSGTVTSVGLSSSDLSVSGSPVTSSGSITADLTATGISAGTYSGLTVDSKGRATAGTTRSVSNNVSRSLNSGYTVSASRDSSLSYSISATWTLNALLSGSGSAFLEYSTDGGSSWITVSQAGKTLNLLTVAGSDDMNLSGIVPAGGLVRIRTTATNMTIAYVRGQEALL